MSTKGLYAGTIALVAAVLVSVAAFGMVSTVNLHQQKSYATSIVDAKWETQNAEHFIGKSVADAIADSSFEHGCSLPEIETTLKTKVEAYFSDFEDSFEGCITKNLSVNSPASNQISGSFGITCSKQIGLLSIEYKKNSIQFDKQVFYGTTPLGDCGVDVMDNISGECEVDTIAGNPGDCGN